MSTTAGIGILEPDGKVRAVYLHWDGYPSHAGAVLELAYADVNKARALISLGDLSVLDRKPAPPPGVAHSFAERAPDTTLAYIRDGHEPAARCRARIFASRDAYARKGSTRLNADYLYLFADGGWNVFAGGWMRLEVRLGGGEK